ncbi:MAG TPA: serine hydrolase [Pyrinomonadaceae bacterium]|nr:serine hydrolase [Pyrinomonadaceae bacterium]
MKLIKVRVNQIAASIALCLLLAVNGAAQTKVSNQDPTARVDEYLNALVKQDRFSGAVLLARDGKVLLSKGYGMANFEDETPNTPQTKFRLGSITKQFTAMATLILQERGKLSVQDSVCKYVENCPSGWQPVTIHHLLTHTSGIPNMTSFPEFRKVKMFPSSPLESIAIFKDKPLEFAPGEKFNYSNSGYILLGYIVERAAGQPYADFLRENIFQPLGMKNTDYDVNSAIVKHRASGYTRGANGIANADYINMTIPFAAGGLYSTVEDLYLWDRAFYTEKLVSKKSLEAMNTPFKNGYGYGVGMGEQYGLKVIEHGGGIEGFSTDLARFPVENATVIVLSNIDSTNTGGVAKHLGGLLLSDKVSMPSVINVSPQVLQQYTGRYQVADDTPTEDISVDGNHLNIKVSGGNEVNIVPVAKDEFVMEDDFAVHFIFHRDQGGNVESYTFKVPHFERLSKRIVLFAPSLQGNTTFRLKGYPAAKIVNLAGTFNEWKPSSIVCGKEGAEWICRVELKPGKYLYKFIVDGHWITDPANPAIEDDGRGNTNSVIEKR